MYRDELKSDRLYKEMSSGQYFWSSDRSGVSWFDTEEEARDEAGLNLDEKVYFVDELSDFDSRTASRRRTR